MLVYVCFSVFVQITRRYEIGLQKIENEKIAKNGGVASGGGHGGH